MILRGKMILMAFQGEPVPKMAEPVLNEGSLSGTRRRAPRKRHAQGHSPYSSSHIQRSSRHTGGRWTWHHSQHQPRGASLQSNCKRGGGIVYTERERESKLVIVTHTPPHV